ncbi:DUF6328 family protein [Streptacidiphilus melanogenes]|uniref:DUF6328 family protein n=1 Tax=Streptacidiphilus melanogenes TaxID=411235 RepID=UPI0006947F50|nr:DUF6328 family protein [Streptacidiphilus melanogenes]
MTTRPGGRNESVEESADRRWTDLVQEVRIAQTGAQIMFGFLLSVAFTDRFARLHGFDRSLYDTVVILGAVATGTLIAPVTYHRILAGQHVKPRMVHAVSRLVGLGVTLLALAIGCALLLLMRVAGLGWGAWLVAGLVLAWFASCWVALPLFVRRHRDTRSDDRSTPAPSEGPAPSEVPAPSEDGEPRPSRDRVGRGGRVR